MILKRIGNKQRIAQKIIAHFPKHDFFIDLFFGAGGIFFQKPKAKYNLLNDLDGDVYNLFNVLLRKKDEFKRYVSMIPYHEDFWRYCKTAKPSCEVERAVVFIVLSNFGYLGKPDTLKIGIENAKELLLQRIETTYQFIVDGTQFTDCDFRDCINKIAFRHEADKMRTFCYADPPYIGTGHNYSSGFTEQDHLDLVEMLCGSGLKFAISEFNNDFVTCNAKSKGLFIYEIGERQALKNRSVEILITNYKVTSGLF